MKNSNIQTENIYSMIENRLENIYIFIDGYMPKQKLKELYILLTSSEYRFLFSEYNFFEETWDVSPIILEVNNIALFRSIQRLNIFGWFWIGLSNNDIDDVYRYFKNLVTAYSPQKDEVIFRFYNGEIFSNYLNNCTQDEINELLGPINSSFFHISNTDWKTVVNRRATTPSPQKSPWWIIKDQHLNIPSLINMKILHTNITSYLWSNHFQFAQGIVNEEGKLECFATRTVARSEALGFNNEDQIYKLIDLTVIAGEGFENATPKNKIIRGGTVPPDKVLDYLSEFVKND
ncbi:DUF4123 domain-containing protein [Zooshikella marina]|uniref:DUF4123 domain-containing protein n=1 Tax=Zooshikella ganghwensis TaxID=202772 RepID=UPI001BB0B62B|nr:DUF4123 domain-containing protein [Zooshikella ganghwensis]MBU2706442.1 DUF4123 domain-containing protein [Zooshikella ganghwensis]